MKYLLVFSTFLIGCSRGDYIKGINIFNGVDPELQSYFNTFTYETGAIVTNITGGFTDLSSPTVGLCVYNDVWNEVRIDKAYWATIKDNESLKEQIMFHELQHCSRHVGHIPNQAPDGQPLSIMNPYAFNAYQGQYFQSRRADYINALKNDTIISYP